MSLPDTHQQRRRSWQRIANGIAEYGPVQSLVDRMVAVYEDPVRQEWMRRQMEAWVARREMRE